MINDYNINFNLLKFFLATAESESIAEASEKLEYSSSTVSTNISTLEKQWGVKLFTRNPLRLNETGEEIYKVVKSGNSDIEFAKVIIDSKNNIENGKIIIG